MGTPKIKKSNSSEHHYSDREKEQALENYRELVVTEVDRMYALYDLYLEQVNHKNFKSDNYDFELHNQLSFDIEQCKRRVHHAAEHVEKNYDVQPDVPNFDILLENYQKNK
ncbi:MAG: hypothetical protein MRY57_01405 [Candidatus Pacebacteria bacterium]|nr:hypothetical protein [Candidatus Paceibacterota bacterium]